MRPAVDHLRPAALAERPGGDRPRVRERPGEHHRAVELAVEVRLGGARSRALGAEQQRPRRATRRRKRRGLDARVDATTALESRDRDRRRAPGRGCPRVLDQTPSAIGSPATTRSRRPPCATSKPGRPSGSSQSAKPSAASGLQLDSSTRRRPAGSSRCEPGPGGDDEPVGGPQRGVVGDLDVGAGPHRLATAVGDRGDLDRRRRAARQPHDRRLELGRRRDHHPQALAGERREPVGVADDDVPVGGRAHPPSGGGAALTSSIASATCSQDQRKSSIGWLSAGCSR